MIRYVRFTLGELPDSGHPLVEDLAGRSLEVVRIGRARRIFLAAAAPGLRQAESIEAIEVALGLEEADAAREAQLVGEVVRDLAEHRLVLIEAHLLRQPPGVGPSRYFQYRREVVDQVILRDVVPVAVVEHADHRVQRQVDGRRDAQLVALQLVAVDAQDVLGRVDERAGIVEDVEAHWRAVRRVVVERIVDVVRVRHVVAIEIGGGVDQIEIADLALDGERGLPPLVLDGLGIEARRP